MLMSGMIEPKLYDASFLVSEIVTLEHEKVITPKTAAQLCVDVFLAWVIPQKAITNHDIVGHITPFLNCLVLGLFPAAFETAEVSLHFVSYRAAAFGASADLVRGMQTGLKKVMTSACNP
jgi:hypothetical protein